MGIVYEHLKSERFVIAASGSHKPGHAGKGKPLLVAARQGAAHEKMLRDLFDPLLYISHHVCYLCPSAKAAPRLTQSQYQLPANPVTQAISLTQRLLASQADDMPPPATPASALRKRAGMESASAAASGLDYRMSMTPFQTPVRPRRGQSQPVKRKLDDLERGEPLSKDASTPGSTFKRLRSLQTQYVLDARGLPSSPAV